MPTIDELAPAAAASDGDELMLSQSGIARRVTRAQLLSGVQPALSLASGSLLGRVSSGVGGVEALSLGDNFSLHNGVLDCPALYDVASSIQGAPMQPGDLVAIAQGGENRVLDYGTFMGGLSQVAGLDGSGLLSAATGGGAPRMLADHFGDALAIASFGAVGDGIIDDTAAFLRAVATGRPLRLDAKVYLIAGPMLLQMPVIMLGVAGGSVLRRGGPTGTASAWIQISGSSFQAEGVSFDANHSYGSDIPAVAVTASCTSTAFLRCGFLNSWGPTMGCGLSIDATTGSSHILYACLATGNGWHGVTVNGTGCVSIEGCTASSNIGNGLELASGLAARLSGNTCSGNDCGISYGPWALPAPLAAGGGSLIASANSCTGNASWGMAVAGSDAAICSNSLLGNGQVSNGGGLLAWTSRSIVSQNMVSGGAYGIDARGASCSIIAGNVISGASVGCAAGGCSTATVSDNVVQGSGWGVVVSAFEPTRSVVPTSDVSIHMNRIAFTAAQGGGILLLDGVQSIAVTQNAISGTGSAGIEQALYMHTDAALVSGNRWLNQGRASVAVTQVAGMSAVVCPDVADEVLVVGSSTVAQTLLTSHQVDTLGQVMFVRVTDCGSNYTRATISLTGSGTGAAASAIIFSGQISWIIVTNPGSGYGPVGAQVEVSIAGDGSGASASASAGLPALETRRLRLIASADLRLTQAGSQPVETSWSGFDITVPGNGAAEFEGLNGHWCALASPPVDYLLPTGDGDAIVQSSSGGDVILRPSAGGNLTIASSQEPVGCVCAVGRGSPLGRIVAPPGSEFRNLDGGVGNTLWIKQTGTDSSGWAAIA